MERASVRRQRELERVHKANAKMLERERAAYEVDVYNNQVDILRSIHKECGPCLDWTVVRDAPAPVAPAPRRHSETAAQQALDGYTPGFFDALFGRTESKRAALAGAVAAARRADDAEYREALVSYNQAAADWDESRALAARILAGDPQAHLEAIDGLAPFAEITGLGSSVQLIVDDGGAVEALLHVNGAIVIPSEIKSLLQSGKLSVKKMPQGQFFDLYQDYVCGCVLRVARELVALLPVRAVVVTAVGDVLNPSTGHVETCPILSVAVPRATLGRLNFNDLDPSDSLRNFVHRMSFRKGRGFEPWNALPLLICRSGLRSWTVFRWPSHPSAPPFPTMKVLVFGATAAAGGSVLRACLDSPHVEEVRAIVRRPLKVTRQASVGGAGRRKVNGRDTHHHPHDGRARRGLQPLRGRGGP
jgi:hypothetical protein